MRTILPTPWAMTISHIVTFPPPCFSFFFIYWWSSHSPGLLQHHCIPSNPKMWKIDSSEKFTALQLAGVQSRWAAAHFLHTPRFFFEMNRTVAQMQACPPSPLSTPLTVSTETSGKYMFQSSIALAVSEFVRCQCIAGCELMRMPSGVAHLIVILLVSISSENA